MRETKREKQKREKVKKHAEKRGFALWEMSYREWGVE
jgi:hypothetical protein